MYIIKTEQGKDRDIRTVKEAKAVIIATSMSRCLTREEVLLDPDLTKVANFFDIDLGTIIVKPSIDHRDFPFTYSFK